MYIIRLDTYESNNYSLIGSFDKTTEVVSLQNSKNSNIKRKKKNRKHSIELDIKCTRIGHKNCIRKALLIETYYICSRRYGVATKSMQYFSTWFGSVNKLFTTFDRIFNSFAIFLIFFIRIWFVLFCFVHYWLPLLFHVFQKLFWFRGKNQHAHKQTPKKQDRKIIAA